RQLGHALYLGVPADVPLLAKASGRLVVTTADAAAAAALASFGWQAWRDGAWWDLPAALQSVDATGTTIVEHAHGALEPSTPPELGLGLTRRWLRAEAPLPDSGEVPLSAPSVG